VDPEADGITGTLGLCGEISESGDEVAAVRIVAEDLPVLDTAADAVVENAGCVESGDAGYARSAPT
jgi:hypothetical protein